MSNITNWFENLPLWLKVMLALPILDTSWMIYRIFKSTELNNTAGAILGVILIVLGLPWIWLVDMITLILRNEVIWID